MYTDILSLKINSKEAPELIRVLPLGYVSSEKGDFIVDRESFRMISEHFRHRGIDVVIDYEHQTLADVQAPASGWIKEFLLKDDGIFARVEWTEHAKEYFRRKEYRYLSPVVMVRNSDRKAVQIHSVALTNTPAINGMLPIINTIKPAAGSGLSDVEKEICRMTNVSEKDFIIYRALMQDGYL